jgi:hypothetical protein
MFEIIAHTQVTFVSAAYEVEFNPNVLRGIGYGT